MRSSKAANKLRPNNNYQDIYDLTFIQKLADGKVYINVNQGDPMRFLHEKKWKVYQGLPAKTDFPIALRYLGKEYPAALNIVNDRLIISRDVFGKMKKRWLDYEEGRLDLEQDNQQESKEKTTQSGRINPHNVVINSKEVNYIGIQDVVVLCNVFRCEHEGHTIRDITARINYLSFAGKVCTSYVAAGYCEQCRRYFIMEDSFQQVREKGVLLCRVIDEKCTAAKQHASEMELAKESVLMEYGYSVSKQRGLTAMQRTSILALLIDYGVISKSAIISYLDFFIFQRQNQWKNFSDAIRKWESDIEFVEKYRTTELDQIDVDTIYR